ncbi:hypothetical protein R3P38DRAFT_3095186 [Favolaschia claudopus]|uniref:F-box domain-containing protein n=1 Tax=Favolaschia claudopus TaxID=2862362 RepID=A0AAV9ZQ58_9AGAR
MELIDDPSKLHLLPTELWIKCWSYTSNWELRRLVRVCRYFCDICLPLLFQEQTVRTSYCDREGWISVAHSLHRGKLRLKKLQAAPHAAFVRYWRFQGTDDYESLEDDFPSVVNIGTVEETYLELLQTFVTSLGSFQNLRSLQMSYVELNRSVRRTLKALERLETLELSQCCVVGRTGPVLSLQEFKLGKWWETSTQREKGPLKIASARALRKLSLDSGHPRPFLDAYLTNPPSTPLHNLVSLHVTLKDSMIDQFRRFLCRCPQLLELEIESFLSAPPKKSLRATAIPRLHSFKGPRLLAAYFISDRPVTALELAHGSGFKNEHKPAKKDIPRDLTLISDAAPAVQSFAIRVLMPVASEVCAAITTHWPNLSELRLVLREVRIPRATVDTDGLDSDDDELLAELEAEPNEPAIDERAVELSDCDTLSTTSSPSWPNIVLRDDDSDLDGELEESVPVPKVLLPGSMYAYGQLFPFPQPRQAIEGSPRTTAELVDKLCAPSSSSDAPFLTLPTSLHSLHLIIHHLWHHFPHANRSSAFTIHNQHRVLLALEGQMADLRELDFGARSVWRRYGDVWTDVSSGAKIASMCHA